MTIRLIAVSGNNRTEPFTSIDAMLPGDQTVLETATSGQDGIVVFSTLDNTVEYFFRPHKAGVTVFRQGIAQLNGFESPVNHGFDELGADYTLQLSDGTLGATDHTLDTGLELDFDAYGGGLQMEFSANLHIEGTFAAKNNPIIKAHIAMIITDPNGSFMDDLYTETLELELADTATKLSMDRSVHAFWYTEPLSGTALPGAVNVRIQAWLDDSSDADGGSVLEGAQLTVKEFISNATLAGVLNGDITEVP